METIYITVSLSSCLVSVQWCFIHRDAEESRSVVLRFSAAVHAAGTEAADSFSPTCRPHQRR